MKQALHSLTHTQETKIIAIQRQQQNLKQTTAMPNVRLYEHNTCIQSALLFYIQRGNKTEITSSHVIIIIIKLRSITKLL